ncbi:MAG TPA: pilus assembly protein [Clostridiaceae bacterium]|nr:pilus assembly protein [Clostridiaceae bacterium]
MRINLYSSKGSMTIEASIIMPVIILCVIALLFIPVYLYKQTSLHSMTNKAAERAYVVWRNVNGDMETGKVLKEELNSDSLYRRMYDPFKDIRLETVRSFIESKLSKKVVFPGNKANEGPEAEITLKDNLILKNLDLTVKDTVGIFTENYLGLFDPGKNYSFNSSSTAFIYDPAEFIRNVDFLVEIKKELEKEYPELQDTSGKLKERLKDISKWIEKAANKQVD